MGCLFSRNGVIAEDEPVSLSSPPAYEDAEKDVEKDAKLATFCDVAERHSSGLDEVCGKLLIVTPPGYLLRRIVLDATAGAELLMDFYAIACASVDVMDKNQLDRKLLQTLPLLSYNLHDPVEMLLRLYGSICYLMENVFLMPTFSRTTARFVTGTDHVPRAWAEAIHEPRLTPRDIVLAIRNKDPAPFVLATLLLEARKRRAAEAPQ